MDSKQHVTLSMLVSFDCFCTNQSTGFLQAIIHDQKENNADD